MAEKEKKFKVNMSFNDLIKKTLSDAESKVTKKKDKEIIELKNKKITLNYKKLNV